MNLGFVILLLAACRSPEQKASDVATAYIGAGLDVARSYPLACPDDQAAKPMAEALAELSSVQTGGPLGDALSAIAKATANAVRTVDSVVVGEDKQSAQVAFTARLDGQVLGSSVLQLRVVDGNWCVVTGWAEAKRVDELRNEASAGFAAAQALMQSWDLEAARAGLEQVKATLAGLTEQQLGFDGTRLLKSTESSLVFVNDVISKRIAGRWLGNVAVDPITDDENVTVSLGSVDGVSNIVGDMEHATIIARCKQKRLDLYVASPVMLDADWRSDTVRGRSRFGDSVAEPLSGGVSTDRQAMFFRDPRGWLKRFAENENSTWTVELPRFSKQPFAVKFDLTGAATALQKVTTACE